MEVQTIQGKAKQNKRQTTTNDSSSTWGAISTARWAWCYYLTRLFLCVYTSLLCSAVIFLSSFFVRTHCDMQHEKAKLWELFLSPSSSSSHLLASASYRLARCLSLLSLSRLCVICSWLHGYRQQRSEWHNIICPKRKRKRKKKKAKAAGLLLLLLLLCTGNRSAVGTWSCDSE